MTLAKIYKGPRSVLDDKPVEEGSIYFTTDTQEIFADIPGDTRKSYTEKDTFTAVSRAEVEAIFKKYPFENGSNNGGSNNIDKDELYAYVLKKILNDPAAIFQGATATSDSLPGLVPPLPDSIE